MEKSFSWYYIFFSWSIVFKICQLHLAGFLHRFNTGAKNWGLGPFISLGELYDPHRGFLVNDTLIVEAEVIVLKEGDYWMNNSTKATSYVGLKNQGATCYMNSLLQTLYHIPYFRKVNITILSSFDSTRIT